MRSSLVGNDGAMSIRCDENTKARAVRLVREHRETTTRSGRRALKAFRHVTLQARVVVGTIWDTVARFLPDTEIPQRSRPLIDDLLERDRSRDRSRDNGLEL